MMRTALLISGLLTGVLLDIQEAKAQLYNGMNNSYNRPPKALMPPIESQRRTTAREHALVLAQFPLQPEPDSATRHLFARHHVKSVLRLRLDDNGQVVDTAGYQEMDRHGRWVVRTTSTPGTRTRRQWSYNDQGECLSLLESPTVQRPFSVRYDFDPDQRQGVQQVLMPNGRYVNLAEVQIFRNADTTLTQFMVHALTIRGQAYGQDRIVRTFTFAPHPDTLLTFTQHYDKQGRNLSSQALYRLQRHGRLREEGELNVQKAAKLLPATTAAEGSPMLLALRQQLRSGQFRQVRNKYYYDAQARVIRHEQTIAYPGGSSTLITRRFTYNTLNQIIGREEMSQEGFAPAHAHYTVFSYSPEGLITGETTDSRSNAPAFYRYQYQYFE